MASKVFVLTASLSFVGYSPVESGCLLALALATGAPHCSLSLCSLLAYYCLVKLDCPVSLSSERQGRVELRPLRRDMAMTGYRYLYLHTKRRDISPRIPRFYSKNVTFSFSTRSLPCFCTNLYTNEQWTSIESVLACSLVIQLFSSLTLTRNRIRKSEWNVKE